METDLFLAMDSKGMLVTIKYHHLIRTGERQISSLYQNWTMSCHFLVLLSLTNATSLYRSKQKLSFVASHFLLQLVMLFHPDQFGYLDCRLVWLMGWTKAPFLLSEGLTHILPISPGPQIYIALYIDCLSPLGLLQSLTTMVAIKSRGHPYQYDANQEVCSSWVARWAEKKRTGGEILHSVICQMLLLPSTNY